MHKTIEIINVIVLIAGFAATLLGLFLVIRQLKESRRSREAQICLTLSEMSMSPDIQSALDFVWSIDLEFPLKKDQFAKAEKVCVFFELVGTFIVEKYMDQSLIAGFYGGLLTGSYDKLYPFIFDQRLKPYNGNYASNFEKAAQLLTTDIRVSSQNPREDIMKIR